MIYSIKWIRNVSLMLVYRPLKEFNQKNLSNFVIYLNFLLNILIRARIKITNALTSLEFLV